MYSTCVLVGTLPAALLYYCMLVKHPTCVSNLSLISVAVTRRGSRSSSREFVALQ